MAQGKFRDGFDVLFGNLIRAPPRRMGPSAAQPDQVSTQTIDTGGKAALGNLRQGLIIQLDTVQPRPRLSAALAQRCLLFGPLGAEGGGIAVEIQATPEDLPALGRQGLPA